MTYPLKKKKKKKIDISVVDTYLCFMILSSYMPMMMLCITSENNRNIKHKFLDCWTCLLKNIPEITETSLSFLWLKQISLKRSLDFSMFSLYGQFFLKTTLCLTLCSYYVTYAFQSESSLNECQGTPCSKQAQNLKFELLTATGLKATTT